VQGHRFDLRACFSVYPDDRTVLKSSKIVEDFGCVPATYWSWPAIFLVYVPPIIFSLATTVYSGKSPLLVSFSHLLTFSLSLPVLAIKAFVQRRAQFGQMLQTSQTGLNTSRYLRLLGMAVTTVTCSLGFTVFILVLNFQAEELRVYDTWADVHSDWLRIGQFPRIEAPIQYWTDEEISWMLLPITAFIFFAFFGFGQEALSEYSRWGNGIAKYTIHRKRLGESTLPSFT
jgi:pheromone a factor receptor